MSCGFQKLRVEWNLKMNCSSLEMWWKSNTFIVKRGYNEQKAQKQLSRLSFLSNLNQTLKKLHLRQIAAQSTWIN